MIVFDLACARGHVFEAWFGTSDDYEAQRKRGLVDCPVCGSAEVSKAVMAPNVAPKGNQHPPHPAVPAIDKGEPQAMPKAMLRALAELQARVLEASDYVGPRFAEEARAIHYGEAEQRAIYGQTTPQEANSLLDDGIAVAPLPFPVRPPGTDN